MSACRGQVTDLGRGQPADDDGTVLLDRGPGVGFGQSRDEELRRGRDDTHGLTLVAAQDLADTPLRDERAPPDHDELLRGQRHLVDQVARHEHGAALGGEVAEQVADPPDPFGVQPVDRLVEEEDRRGRRAGRRRCRGAGPCPARTCPPVFRRRRSGRRCRAPRQYERTGCRSCAPGT